ncbi:AmmeMemoRadiSam system protein A [Patescibacteria group bacterium]|nr:AmmeMemoRadiSam system protein A [Patescibacteria group bacterium]MBU0963505.1 AmmeMemoRadiSam system protein A [Patescibacteria group bacterium]
MDPHIQLAYDAIKEYLASKKTLPLPDNLPNILLAQKAGIFVSLHKKSDNSLRGCIGTFLPTQKNIAEEIISNAVSAAFKDPRFMPLQKDELNDLAINVDVLAEPEPVTDMNQLDPVKYGLIVKSGNKSGLLLPDIGIDNVEEQINICCQKGGINPAKEKIELFRFTVNRHK